MLDYNLRTPLTSFWMHPCQSYLSQAKVAKPLMLQLKSRYFKNQGMAKSGVPLSKHFHLKTRQRKEAQRNFARRTKKQTTLRTRLPTKLTTMDVCSSNRERSGCRSGLTPTQLHGLTLCLSESTCPSVLTIPYFSGTLPLDPTNEAILPSCRPAILAIPPCLLVFSGFGDSY
jgi:hypothetical protein